jgi:P27 family predicted phage terminase small subunit
MGQRGPAPQPRKLRALKGDKPEGIEIEPTKKGVPRPPSYLSTEALKVWKRISTDLYKAGLLTWWDRDSFAQYCSSVDVARQAYMHIQQHGIMLTLYDKNGNEYEARNPMVTVYKESLNTTRALAREFGLTPSSRSQISIEAPQAERDGAAYLS